ncbi:MAG TPA: hypothetical protein ENK10_06650 [Acidobacteria bacterium]|nr:hypothetical protein [Acidobacteriota bacterium]
MGVAATELSLAGWDLEAALRRKIDEKLGRAAADAGGDAAQDVLDAVQARVDLDRLPWRLEEVRVVSGSVSATGGGTFDPLAAAVALGLEATVDSATTAELTGRYRLLGALVDSDGRLALPLGIEGALTSPSISVDLKKATGRSRREVGRKLLDKLKRKFR